MASYRKTIAAMLTGLLGWATAVVQSDPGRITATEWIAAATVVVTAVVVFLVPNDGNA